MSTDAKRPASLLARDVLPTSSVKFGDVDVAERAKQHLSASKRNSLQRTKTPRATNVKKRPAVFRSTLFHEDVAAKPSATESRPLVMKDAGEPKLPTEIVVDVPQDGKKEVHVRVVRSLTGSDRGSDRGSQHDILQPEQSYGSVWNDHHRKTMAVSHTSSSKYPSEEAAPACDVADVEADAMAGKSDPQRQASFLWGKLKGKVKRGSLLLRKFREDEDGDSIGDDVSVVEAAKAGLPYEFSLTECVVAIALFLFVGMMVYSIFFEHWTFIDSLYFTVVTFTTIGFGDLVPRTDPERLFTAFFALVGIAFLGIALGIIGSRVVEAQIRAFDVAQEETARHFASMLRLRKRKKRRDLEDRDEVGLSGHTTPDGALSPTMSRASSTSSLSTLGSVGSMASVEDHYNYIRNPYRADSPTREIYDSPKKPPGWCSKVLKRVLPYSPAVALMLFGALVIGKVEGWNIIDSCYWLVVTSATIGYGDLTPSTPLAKAIAVPLIPILVGILGHILGTIASSVIQNRREVYQRQLWSKELKLEDLRAMDADGDGVVTELEYFKFMLLVMKKVNRELLDQLADQFRQLDVTNSGDITKSDLELLAKRRLKQVKRKLGLSSYKYQLLHPIEESKDGGQYNDSARNWHLPLIHHGHG